MKQIIHCPICKGNNFVEYLTSIDFSVSKEEFKVDRCTNCSLLLTNPRPEDDNLNRYYLSPDYIPHNNSSKGLLNYLYKKARFFSLRNKLNFIITMYFSNIFFVYGKVFVYLQD